MTKSERFDCGAGLRVAVALTGTLSTAGAEAALSGTVIDRFTDFGGVQYNSAVLLVAATEGEAGAIGGTDDVDVAVVVNDGATSSPVTLYATLATADELLTDGAATPGFKAYKVDLSTVNRYFRPVITPDFSASGTDTAVIAAYWVFGGASNYPTTLQA
jgi:hypothetical protein